MSDKKFYTVKLGEKCEYCAVKEPHQHEIMENGFISLQAKPLIRDYEPPSGCLFPKII